MRLREPGGPRRPGARGGAGRGAGRDRAERRRESPRSSASSRSSRGRPGARCDSTARCRGPRPSGSPGDAAWRASSRSRCSAGAPSSTTRGSRAGCAACARAEADRRARDWLGRLGIGALADRPADRLSGGEAQRTSLARAFATAPEVLFLDEPFAALDAPTRETLLDDLGRLLGATRTTTVLVTHDRAEALRLGDRVAVLLEGRLRRARAPGTGLRRARQRGGGPLRRRREPLARARPGACRRRDRGGRRSGAGDRRRGGASGRARADRPPAGGSHARPARDRAGRPAPRIACPAASSA